MIADQHTDREWLRPRDVADLFNVSPKTVIRWARAGKLPHRRTLGGWYQFPAGVVGRMLSFAPATEGPLVGEEQAPLPLPVHAYEDMCAAAARDHLTGSLADNGHGLSLSTTVGYNFESIHRAEHSARGLAEEAS